MAIAPFQFQYQSPRVAAAPIIDKPTWGPPDVANLAYQSIASIVPTLATAYKAGDKERNLQQGRAAAGELNFGQQATALGQPGGAYGATIPAAPGTNTPTGNLPQFAKIEGASPSANISGLISSTASNYQLAPDYLEKLVQVESKGDPNAMNKGSKASGLGQFIPSTWKQYGNGASPFDPGANLDATARLTLDNANFLRKSLGREPTQGELYLAHQQGAAGAAKLLSNSDARAFDVVPPKHVMSNLPGAMRARASQMTAGEFASLWTNRFGAPAPAFAGPGGAQQQGIQASPAFAQGGPAMNMPQLAPQAAAGAPAPVGMNVPPPDQFASLGGAPQATGISPTQAPAPVPPTPGVQSGAPLFATPGVPMQMPPEAQVAQAPQPAPQAPVQFGQAPQPQMPAPQPQAAPPAMPAPAPAAPPAAQGQQNPELMRRIVQAAIGSGDPTLQALAGQFMKQSTPEYGFTNVDGTIYRTDASRGTVERVGGGDGSPAIELLAPGDPRRPAALANDPRTFQRNRRTGAYEPIAPYASPEDKPAPVVNGKQWNPLTKTYDIPVGAAGGETVLQPGDARRQQFNIPDDGRAWKLSQTDKGPQIEPISKPPDATEKTFDRERQLRSDFNTSPQVKNYNDMSVQYDNIRSSLSDPSGASDISLIFSYMKMLDPGSVVREGEYATAANSGGVGSAVMNAYNRMVDGQRLTDKQREDFANRAGRLFENQYRKASKDAERARETAQSYGLDPDKVAKIPEFKFERAKVNRSPESIRESIESGGPGSSRVAPLDIDGMKDADIEKLPAGTYIRKGGRIGRVATDKGN